MSQVIHNEKSSERTSFDRLLIQLYETPFRYSISRDRNRAEDGIDLRYRFAVTQGYEEFADEILDILGGPCTVLEMLVALAIHCEEDIMDDPDIGDRTGQWFWGMIINLGLGGMYNENYDRRYVGEIVNRFLDREYEPNGEGGLFTIRHCDVDLRDVEIWHQMCWYFDSIM